MTNQEKELLLSIESELNFKELVNYIEAHQIKLKFSSVKNCLGVATPFGIYVDAQKICSRYTPKQLFFTILHEIAHYRKLVNRPFEDVISEFSNEDFEDFSAKVIEEEIFADRYACYIYFCLNKEAYPKYLTQMLEDEGQQRYYKNFVVPLLFGKIKTSEDYHNLMNEYIAIN